MSYKAIFCDFDGTLVGPDLQITDKVIAAIRRFQATRGHFVIATGRGMHGSLENKFKTLKLNSPQIIHGGAEIINPVDQTVIKGFYIPPDVAESIIDILPQRQLYPEVCQGATIYAPLDEIIKRPGMEGYRPIQELRVRAVSKIRIVVNQSDLDQANEVLRNILSPYKEVNFHQSNTVRSCGFDITSFNATKEHAVKEVQALLGVTAVESAAIGDGLNDLPLFRACSLAFAMGHSPDELKKVAHKSVSNWEHDGAAEAIEYLLNQ